MLKSLRRAIATAVTMLLVVVGLSSLGPSLPAQAALTGKMFDPGLIISDSVFYDFGTMTVDEIQRFLESKVPICNANDGGPTCLRYYKMDTMAKAASIGRCSALPAATNQTAAQIIFSVSHACGINPRVLLVLLQKEQGLVQATNPTAYMYRAATGYACPDSNPSICGKGSQVTGLFNQLYKAAGQLQWYGDPNSSFTYLKVGTDITMHYHPNKCLASDANGNCTSSKDICGTKSFPLKSQATANLYYYTPYVPNASALANLYGSGDSCSAYGNRNFWRFYSDWFGSTIGGGFLLKSATSGTYLIVDNKKYLIDIPDLVTSLSPLGPLGTISEDYLNSFTDAGILTRLVKSPTGALFMLDSGQRFSVASCAIATTLSLDCTQAVTLTANQLAALPVGGVATSLVVDTDGNRYLVQNGTKREILDDASVTAEGLHLPARSALGLSAFSDLPWGQPIAKPATLFTNSTTGNLGVYIGGQFFEISPELAAEVDFSVWFTKSSGTMTSPGLSLVYNNQTIQPIVHNDLGTFLLTPSGRRTLSNPEEFVADSPEVSAEFTASISNAGDAISAPLLAENTEGAVFLVAAQQKRPMASRVDLDSLKLTLGQPSTAFGDAALAQLASGPAVFAPGSVLKARTSKKYYYVDAYNRLVAFTSPDAFSVLNLPPARGALDSAISAIKTANYSGGLVECAGTVYLTSAGSLYAVDPEAIPSWPGKPFHLSEVTCAMFSQDPQRVGKFVRNVITGAGYYISGGQKHSVPSWRIYKSLRGTGIEYLDVAAAVLNSIPTGSVAKAKVSVVPGSKTYKVVAGDSLGAIATRLKTTVAILKKLNKLTSDSIRVGQVLVIP